MTLGYFHFNNKIKISNPNHFGRGICTLQCPNTQQQLKISNISLSLRDTRSQRRWQRSNREGPQFSIYIKMCYGFAFDFTRLRSS